MRKVLFQHFFVSLFLLALLYCFAAHAEDKCDPAAIVCQALCKHDGDQMGIIVKGKCYCANYLDVSKVVMTVNTNMRTNNQPKTKDLD